MSGGGRCPARTHASLSSSKFEDKGIEFRLPSAAMNESMDEAWAAYDLERGAAHPNNRGTIMDHSRRAEAAVEAEPSPPASEAPPQPQRAGQQATPSTSLQRIRGLFTPSGMLAHSRSESTFKKHQSENERLGLYFWLDSSKHVYLAPELLRELGDADVDIDYTYLENRHAKYIRSGGKKPLEQRKEEYRFVLLRGIVGGFLGKPGSRPPRRAFDLEALSSNVDVYLQYIAEKVKADGSLMKPGVYKGYRSSLTYLYQRHSFATPVEYDKQVSRYMQGAARIANDARQHGEVSKE